MPKAMLLVDSRAACAQEAGELIGSEVHPMQMVEIGEVVEFGTGGEVVLRSSFSPAGGEKVEEGELDDDGMGGAEGQDNDKGLGEAGEEEEDGTSGPLTIFKSVGVGLQDVAIACLVVERAEEMGDRGEEVGVRVGGYDV